MKLFKKISAIAASAIMIGMTMGVAAAANYPSPFVVGTAADVAIVYGTGIGAADMVSAANIYGDLAAEVGTGTSGAGGTVSGGDSVLLAKSSDNFNLQNNMTGVYSGSITSDNLKTLLADGTYIASDNDEFKYEQKITLGAPQLTHFRDSDYESLMGLTAKTPTVGFKITSNTHIMNYTLDFLTDVTTDYVSDRADDIEKSDIPLMGKHYYVTELLNNTVSGYFEKLVLLDSADVGSVKEGETVTVSGHEVSIDWIDSTYVAFLVDGVRVPASGKLVKGDSAKLSDGYYIGVRDVSSKAVSGTIGSASFSIGTGKLELTHSEDIKMNEDSINGVKAYIYKTTGGKLDKIVIQWNTDDESYLTPEHELLMPGFGALKFSMNKLIRNEEEKIYVGKDGDTSIKMTVPIKGGTVNLNLLYSNSTGEFIGIGKAATEKMATTNDTVLQFFDKKSTSSTTNDDWHSYFFATYKLANNKQGETYKLRASVTQEKSNSRNVTDIESEQGTGNWVNVCPDRVIGGTCELNNMLITVQAIEWYSNGNQSVNFTVGTDVNFHTIATPGGLYIYLPYGGNYTETGTFVNKEDMGMINLTGEAGTAPGHDWDTFTLYFDGEDKDETFLGGVGFNLTLDDSSNKLQVSEVNDAGSGGGSAFAAEEVGESTAVYEMYVRDDVAPRVLHYTKSDTDDYAEIYYPTGESETYAEVFLTEAGAVLVPGAGGGALGEVLVRDVEVSTVSSKNLVVVGGSCINSVAANLVGGAYCGSAWTDITGVGSGQFLIKSYAGKYTAGKIALLVAGYEAADTVAATTALMNKVIDTSKEYTGTTSTTTVTEVTAA